MLMLSKEEKALLTIYILAICFYIGLYVFFYVFLY